jgi:hypothetical protein
VKVRGKTVTGFVSVENGHELFTAVTTYKNAHLLPGLSFFPPRGQYLVRAYDMKGDDVPEHDSVRENLYEAISYAQELVRTGKFRCAHIIDAGTGLFVLKREHLGMRKQAIMNLVERSALGRGLVGDRVEAESRS